MREKFLPLVFVSLFILISGCGKDEASPAPSNGNPPASGAPTNGGGGANSGGNCYCDECGCFILYANGSYTDVDSCGAQPQQAPPQQNYYPQNYGNNRPGLFPWLRNQFTNPQQQGNGYPQQNYGYPNQGYGPQQGYGYPRQNYGYPQQGYGYPQQNYGYPQQNYGYPQQGYGYPQQNYYGR
ncbi:MAG: hypothetical protein ACKOA8_18515 [Deltaproteobacteria bacterium]